MERTIVFTTENRGNFATAARGLATLPAPCYAEFMQLTSENAQTLFQANFHELPAVIASAPGRVNLIGEHTDYNGGLVMPMGIERRTFVGVSASDTPQVELVATDLDRRLVVALDALDHQPEEPWADYAIGVLREVARIGVPLQGLRMLITGDVPIGCGLSSSASLEMAVLTALEGLCNFSLDGAEAACLGQRVENDFLGLASGIMDQFACRNARAGHALLLDCSTLQARHAPIPGEEATFVVANTHCTRKLTDSKYNERVAECEEAVAVLRARTGKPSARFLCEFTRPALESASQGMSPLVFRRARHVITENERTREAASALEAGNWSAFGALMNESDHSLRVDYEVTSHELDAMTAIARKLPGCYGSRMTGAGFGGCTVSLVARRKAATFIELLLEEYESQTGLCGTAFQTAPAQGAHR